MATAAVALAALGPAHAAEAPPAATTDSTATETPPPPPPPPTTTPTTTTSAETAPTEQRSTPTSGQPANAPSSTPPAAPTEDKTSKPDDAAGANEEPAKTTPPATDSATPPKDIVKLEDATASPNAPAPASPAPAAPAPAAPAPAAPTPTPAAAPIVIVVIQNTPAAPAATEPEAAKTEGAKTEDAKTEADVAAAPIVSLRPKAAPAAISLLPETDLETAGDAPQPANAVAATRSALTRPHTCARPAARVPLASRCKQERPVAIAGLPATLTYLPSLPEVRAAIARGAPPRAIVRKVEARPPPKSKAAKKHPIAEVRPIVPFGHSGQGMTNDGFSGSAGSASSSRLFAVAVVPLRVPWPSRFARLRLPSTLPHGVILAPPSARPG